MFTAEDIVGNDSVQINESNDCTVISIENETGSGSMTVYGFFNSVYVSFNDFHLNSCESNFNASGNILSIEHCREGRIEWDNGDGSYTYIEAGDMMICSHKVGGNRTKFSFPINHYHGVTISFDIDKAEKTLSCLLGGFSANVKRISERYCKENSVFLMRADSSIEHIFSELYHLPPKIRTDYCKIKILELLLFLDSADMPAELLQRRYYGRANVEKVKKMAAFMSDNIQKRYTISELSKRYDFPVTSMKLCFKAVFGQSVYAYMKSHRMNYAAVLLKNGKQSILETAGMVGYDNAGKFSAAFKDVMGVTPSEYRKNLSEWISSDV